MTEPDPQAPETYAFTCGDCGNSWEQTYERQGQRYLVNGTPVHSPLANAQCPGCEGRTVHVMPPELLQRVKAAESAKAERHQHFPRLHRH
ncbi:hypothetical protein [Streptomyces beijiangensis]|uniref:Uncharacterized protein n=1 Tax=Streptomyces beijiangensis TaxID=163361 RepID=A0A939FB84_9ACTN|nr:hypothetical protein [Streptomyces beijiangensis]MBO0515845.1 hypothetical protein [Streptomyces beijiangensis]